MWVPVCVDLPRFKAPAGLEMALPHMICACGWAVPCSGQWLGCSARSTAPYTCWEQTRREGGSEV